MNRPPSVRVASLLIYLFISGGVYSLPAYAATPMPVSVSNGITALGTGLFGSLAFALGWIVTGLISKKWKVPLIYAMAGIGGGIVALQFYLSSFSRTAFMDEPKAFGVYVIGAGAAILSFRSLRSAWFKT